MTYQCPTTVKIPTCSLPTLIFKSPAHPLESSKPCFLDASRPDTHYLTPSSLRLWCQRFALGLQKYPGSRSKAGNETSGRHGVFQAGDRILLLSENTLYCPVVFLGVVMAGGVFTGANPNFVERELFHQLQDSGAKYILSSQQGLKVALKAAAKAGIDSDHIFLFDDDVDRASSSPRARLANMSISHRHWTELLARPEEAKMFQWPILNTPALAKTTLTLNYSSGSTGIPKGVELSHSNFVAFVVGLLGRAAGHPPIGAALTQTRLLMCLPLYHASSQGLTMGFAVLARMLVYITPGFDIPRTLSLIQKNKLTTLVLSHSMILRMVKAPSVKNFDLSSVMAVTSGGASLSEPTMKAFNSLWPPEKMNLRNAWGMTELVATSITWNPLARDVSLSIGELLPNCEAKIVDPFAPRQEIRGRGPGATGELMIRGPNVMKGYWRNPSATKETISPDGWLRTGDIAYVDAKEDRFFIVDRRKDLIKAKANQIAPAELESVLLSHPAVIDAAVVAVPTRTGSPRARAEPGDEEECPKAYVVLQSDEAAQRTKEKDLILFVEKDVAPYKRLTGGLVFVRALPKTESGKTMKGEVKKWALTGDRTARVRGQRPESGNRRG